MKTVSLMFLAVCVIAVEYVNTQYATNYQQPYYYNNQRRYGVYPSSSGVVRTYIPAGEKTDTTRKEADATVQKVRLDVYFETDCPDSMRFITRQLYPLYQDMEDVMDINLVPYGKASETYNLNSKKYDFRCQHGPSECYGNTVQSCAISLYPKKKDYMNFINCMMAYPRPSHNGHKCARRLSLDWNKIDKCAKGDEGNRLLHGMSQQTESLNPRLHFVPWVVVNKIYTEKNQRMALYDLKSLVCESYKGSHPKCPH